MVEAVVFLFLLLSVEWLELGKRRRRRVLREFQKSSLFPSGWLVVKSSSSSPTLCSCFPQKSFFPPQRRFSSSTQKQQNHEIFIANLPLLFSAGGFGLLLKTIRGERLAPKKKKKNGISWSFFLCPKNKGLRKRGRGNSWKERKNLYFFFSAVFPNSLFPFVPFYKGTVRRCCSFQA